MRVKDVGSKNILIYGRYKYTNIGNFMIAYVFLEVLNNNNNNNRRWYYNNNNNNNNNNE